MATVGKRGASERSAAWLAHQSGALGVGGSNPLAPTILLSSSTATPRARRAAFTRLATMPDPPALHGHRITSTTRSAGTSQRLCDLSCGWGNEKKLQSGDAP